MHLVMIGGSDAGISAALRARELDSASDVTVVVADAYPNFSICGIPYYVSGEVAHWRNLAHRTTADLEATGMLLRKPLGGSPDGRSELEPGGSAAPHTRMAAHVMTSANRLCSSWPHTFPNHHCCRRASCRLTSGI
jgi:hypothetical protein